MLLSLEASASIKTFLRCATCVSPFFRSGLAMNFVEVIASVSRALCRMYFEEKITFSHRLYLRVAQDKITLVSAEMDNIQAMKISIEDAKEIVRSIKRACDLNEIEEIKVGDLCWKTDARIQSAGQRDIVIQLNGPLGFAHELVKRDDASAAVSEFTRKIGL
jgi:23S rRNA pseudoU1915 N3-methylase RlmH